MLTPAKDLVKRAVYRRAEEKDLTWINEHYRRLNFEESHFSDEIIWLAVSMGRPFGVGRLIQLDERSFELGGLFVLESFRNLGVERELVKRLLENTKGPLTIYCIPLNGLVAFYEEFEFTPYSGELEKLPQRLKEKFAIGKKARDVDSLLWRPA